MSDVREDEKHLAGTVYVLSDEQPPRLLLLHHKKFDKWMPPGGHVELDENPYEAAVREAEEETGIDIRDFMPKPERFEDDVLSLPLPRWFLEEQIDAHGDKPAHFHLDVVYVVTVPHQVVSHREAESHDIGWFGKDEALKLPLFDNVRAQIEELFS